jgi:hypothetical protein
MILGFLTHATRTVEQGLVLINLPKLLGQGGTENAKTLNRHRPADILDFPLQF